MKGSITAVVFMSVLVLDGTRPLLAQQSARELYLEGREHLLEERYEQALVQFRRIVAELPTSEEADDAQYNIGYALAELGRDDEALAAFTELLDRWPDSLRVDRARAHRAELLARQGGGNASADLFREVFEGSSSWALKRDTAFALARKGNLAAADVLEQAMERESSSRQIELARILAPLASDPVARRILILGLGSGRSSSVKLRALQSLEQVAYEDDVADAIAVLLANGTSSSVKQHAVLILVQHVATPGARRALAQALEPDNSSSVQIQACRALTGHLLSPEVRPSVTRLFQGGASSSARLQCLESLQPDVNDPAAADVLREAIAQPSNSSSVRLKAIQLAGSSESNAVREVVQAGLERGNSSSVQLQALRAVASGRNEHAAAEALDSLFRQSGVSSSVLIAAIDALAQHMDTPAGPAALGHALSARNSTSVQLRALRLAAEHIHEVEVRNAVLSILEEEGASTSVKLEAVSMLRSQLDDPEVRRIVSRALHPSNSTSVLLKAVESLGSRADYADSREALVGALDTDYSTSVVLSAMDALSPYVASEAVVRDAFVRTMEHRRMSYTARIRAGEQLLPGADAALKARIADAMEDIVVRAGSQRRRRHRDVIEDALDVLEDIDAERAQSLRSKSRARSSRPSTLATGRSLPSPLWHQSVM